MSEQRHEWPSGDADTDATARVWRDGCGAVRSNKWAKRDWEEHVLDLAFSLNSARDYIRAKDATTADLAAALAAAEAESRKWADVAGTLEGIESRLRAELAAVRKERDEAMDLAEIGIVCEVTAKGVEPLNEKFAALRARIASRSRGAGS